MSPRQRQRPPRRGLRLQLPLPNHSECSPVCCVSSERSSAIESFHVSIASALALNASLPTLWQDDSDVVVFPSVTCWSVFATTSPFFPSIIFPLNLSTLLPPSQITHPPTTATPCRTGQPSRLPVAVAMVLPRARRHL